jgi:uncharacterized protein (DUF952 family)
VTIIYKISPKPEWQQAQTDGVFTGAPVDIADGYIHFSSAHQVRETAAKHFAGKDDLVLAAIDTEALGEALIWERSRGGDLFPHLYGPLAMTAVTEVVDLPMGLHREHVFPASVPQPTKP